MAHRLIRAVAVTAGASLASLGLTGFTYTSLVSVSSSSTLPALAANFPSISGDGAKVGFLSDSPDLVSGDTNTVTDAFVRDQQANTTQLISRSTSGALANAQSISVLLADDGQHAVYSSVASNLVSGDTNMTVDVFERDLRAGTTSLVSSSATGIAANGPSVVEGVSSDGTVVAFDSSATNLVTGDTDGVTDTFVRNMTTGQTVMASLGQSGQQLDASVTDAEISGDGQHLVFVTTADNVVSGVGNGKAQVYVRNLQTGSVALASSNGSGNAGDGDSVGPSLSRDGGVVEFQSDADNLVSGDTNAATDVFLRTVTSAVTARISTPQQGGQSDGVSSTSYPAHQSIDAAGCHAVFQSAADNLVPGDANAAVDTFLWDCLTGQVRRVSMRPNDVTPANFGSGHAAISADGNYAAFASRDALQAADTDGHTDIYERFVGASPAVQSVTPATAAPGSTTTLTITGSSFTPSFTVGMPVGTTVVGRQWVSATQVRVAISVSPSAPTGTALGYVMDLGTGPGLSAGSAAYFNWSIASPALRTATSTR